MTSRMAGRILVTALLLSPLAARAEDDDFPFLEATVAQLQARMASGELTSVQLTRAYIERIHKLDSSANGVNSIMEINPDAIAMARHADDLRRHGTVLGPLHGIPVLLKDNIDTGDKMQTGAGSFALVGMPAPKDSTVAANLRAGGAVILGKTTLSEWANWRSFEATSGWSGRGGLTHNPYGIHRNACGSSSGSGAAASANFATVSIGTETDGSIVCPGNANGVVGLKPTVGLVSRAGVVPISHTQDTVGPHARTVADAAVVLGVIQSPTFDNRDAATGDVPLGWRGRFARPTNIPTDYTQFLDRNGLKGARIGITRAGLTGFGPGAPPLVATPQRVLNAIEAAFKVLSDAGATVIDLDAAGFTFTPALGETGVLLYDFKNDVAKYFATRVGVPVAGGTLADAIAFNNAHADVEMPYFNQDIWDLSNSLNTTDPNAPQDPGVVCGLAAGHPCSYNIALNEDQAAGVSMDTALSMFTLDAVVSATDSPAWATDLVKGDDDDITYGTSGLAGGPGYPIIQVPAGAVFGVPIGISFFGTAFSEPKLIKLASGYEAASQARAHNLPTFAPLVPFDHIKGPLQQSNEESGGATRSGASAVSSSAVQSAAAVAAPAVAGAAPAPNQAASAKAKKVLHHL
jgi:amidase